MIQTILVAILLFVSGCSSTQQLYAVQTSVIMAESSVLKSQYESVEGLIRQLQETKNIFTDAEWRSLQNVDATIDMLIMRYDSIVQLNISEISFSDIKFMHEMAVTGYKQARGVVYAHWSEFQPSSQVLLNGFDKQAEQTSNRLTELLANPTNSSINDSLRLISNVMTTAVNLLNVAAVL